MSRIAALVALIAIAIGGVAVAAAEQSQSGEPPSTKPPSTRAAAGVAPAPAVATPGAATPVALKQTAAAEVHEEAIEAADAATVAAAPAVTTADPALAPVTPVAFDAGDQAPGWQQRKGEAALSLIGYRWEDIGFKIKFLPGKARLRAGTYPYEKLIEVYVRPDLSVEETERDIAHELGHAYDWRFNSAAERELFKQVRGYAGRPGWFTCSGCTDYATPAGDFAETFAYWTLGQALPHRGEIAPAPTPDQLAAVRPIFTP